MTFTTTYRKRVNRGVLFLLFMLSCASAIYAQTTIVVAQNGTGNFKTIQEAINSLPVTAVDHRVILIKKGIYKEKIFIDKNFVTLKGEDPANTILSISLARDEWRCENPDDYGTAVINLKGSDIRLENLSFINSYGKDNKAVKTIDCANDSAGFKTIRPVAHQMALRSFNTTRLVVINCIFRAYGGDTVSPWNTENGMFYFKDCVMEGGVDFYCPRGWALAENCTFIAQKSPAGIWHDGSLHESSKTVLMNCTFKGDDGFMLGRYHRDAQFYLVNCNFAKNMANSDIYLVPTGNKIKWGRRVYYFNCHKEGGDYAWHTNNLPAGVSSKDINISWVYDNKWNPKEDTDKRPDIVGVVADKDLVAENMLLYQRANGGWPKHFKEAAINYTRVLTEEERKELQAGYTASKDATIDNNATTKEILYLVKAFKTSKDSRYLTAVENGINYLLQAQYPNGGWPQYFPDTSGYRRNITFNDNAMVNVLNVLQDVVEKKHDLDVVSVALIDKCGTAIQKGIDCILKTQVKQNGILTAWCAQHHPYTLAPANARKFELASLSGMETVGIIRFLMSVNNPGKEIKAAVNAGVQWLEKVKIKGYDFVFVDAPSLPGGKDRVLVEDENSIIWARFYDLQNNDPFFCGRDGIRKRSVAEIEQERRVGYAWYGKWPATLLNKNYPVWFAKWNATK